MPGRLVSRGSLELAALAALVPASIAASQTLHLERLPFEQLAVTSPAERVVGEPGRMRIAPRGCPAAADDAQLRRRIVEIAAQEWGFFGFHVVDQTALPADDRRPDRPWRPVVWLDPEESARVAPSIAGYWAATADGAWILERQNAAWQGPAGIGARWRDPWSAAFISWVMCESGLGDDRFRRHIAHHAYIDQAIAARDDPTLSAAFVAHDVGERAVEPGDLLCRVRRAAYRSVADRRDDVGVGVRSHCDIVVGVDAERERVLAIGGNVQGRVSLKLLPATFETRGGEAVPTTIGRGTRAIFAHLELRAPSIEADALARTPTLRALAGQRERLVAIEHRLAGGGSGGPALDASPVGGDLASP